MDELYILARRVLLDALDALAAHRDAVVLVGAQAIYLRVGETDVAVAAYTTDGDLAIDPARLAQIPPIEQELIKAGFLPKAVDSVGIWITQRETSLNPKPEVAIDLLVPASVSPGTGRRAARLPGHDTRAARIVAGLEGAIVDADRMTLTALEPTDSRAIDLRVAGPAALLVAKVHKIQERQGTPRSADKDALDIFRLLRGTTTDELAERFQRLASDARSRESALAAVELLRRQFADRRGIGVRMTVRALGPLGDEAEITAACGALAGDLLARIRD